MSILQEHIRIEKLMRTGKTVYFPLVTMKQQILEKIVQGAANGDEFLKECNRNIKRQLSKVTNSNCRIPIADAYAVYAEANFYLHLKQKGIDLKRTPGTGTVGQKRPDFLYNLNGDDIYFEVKCLDFEEGDIRHGKNCKQSPQECRRLGNSVQNWWCSFQ